MLNSLRRLFSSRGDVPGDGVDELRDNESHYSLSHQEHPQWQNNRGPWLGIDTSQRSWFFPTKTLGRSNMSTNIKSVYEKVTSDRTARRNAWLTMLKQLAERLPAASGLDRKQIEWKGPDMRSGQKGQVGALEEVVYWADQKDERAAVLVKLTLNEPDAARGIEEDAVEVLVCIVEERDGTAFFQVKHKPIPGDRFDAAVDEITRVAAEEIRKKFSR
jgi:hypothetical protein